MTKEEITDVADALAQRMGYANKEVLTSEEAAAYMGISKSYLYKLTCRNVIPFYKPMGKMCMFNRQELITWLQNNRVSTSDEIKEEANLYLMKKGGMK